MKLIDKLSQFRDHISFQQIHVSLFAMTLGLVFIFHPAQEESSAAQQEPAARWAFETVNEEGAFEQKAGIFDNISCHYKLVVGVHGRALKLDGFTTVITRKKERAPHFTSFFSLEAWVALAAYPWNWCPMLTQEGEQISDFSFAIEPQGHLGFKAAVKDHWLVTGAQE